MVTLDPDQVRPVITRLKRARGQLDGVIRMLEEGRDCEEIVTQIAAVAKAVERAGFTTIATGMRQCLSPAAGQVGEGEGGPGAEAVDGTAEQIARMERLFLSLA